MSAAAEDYRRFADECFRSARVAKTEAERKTFLDMAKIWTKAAAKLANGHAGSAAMTRSARGSESELPEAK
jgi:hypothetical protein